MLVSWTFYFNYDQQGQRLFRHAPTFQLIYYLPDNELFKCSSLTNKYSNVHPPAHLLPSFSRQGKIWQYERNLQHYPNIPTTTDHIHACCGWPVLSSSSPASWISMKKKRYALGMKQSKINPMKSPKEIQQFSTPRCAMKVSYCHLLNHELGRCQEGKYEEERKEV